MIKLLFESRKFRQRMTAGLFLWTIASLLLIAIKAMGLTSFDWGWVCLPLFVIPAPYVLLFLIFSVAYCGHSFVHLLKKMG
jgi:hypothetical protein